MLTLRADNNGEGGIFSLYALIRRHAKWAVVPAMIGGAALLADGIITPPITVTSAIDGLDLNQTTTINIVLAILAGLFFIKEVNITSRYTSLQKNKIAGDWKFIVMEKFLSHDNDLPLFERMVMNLYFLLKKFSLSEEKGLVLILRM